MLRQKYLILGKKTNLSVPVSPEYWYTQILSLKKEFLSHKSAQKNQVRRILIYGENWLFFKIEKRPK